jgi:5'-phosphate synthase pdxT subunit
MSPVIGVLAIQGDVREHARCLEQLEVDVRLVKTAEQLKGIAGLVIPGGESTTMSILAVKNNLFGPLRELRTQIPMYGSCAGLIMLADSISDGRADQETIGGLNITAKRNAFGRQVDSFEIEFRIRNTHKRISRTNFGPRFILKFGV